MNKRLFRKDVSKRFYPTPCYSHKDMVSSDPAYTLSNILQSAQLNRPLPPMRSYNFSSVKDLQSTDIPVVVDDICFAGNLQAQLDVSINNAKQRYKDDLNSLALQAQQAQQQQFVPVTNPQTT